MKKPKKPKKIAYELITDEGLLIYGLLKDLIERQHTHLLQARIALAWCTSWKRNVDGRLKQWACKRASELDRELHPYDFVILLNKNTWFEPVVTDRHREAWLDAALCAAGVAHDTTGEPVVDERDRMVYRIIDFDVVGHLANIARYGFHTRDLENLEKVVNEVRSRVNGEWCGYTMVHNTLVAAGLTIPIEVVAQWSEDERRQARTWAMLRIHPDVPTAIPIGVPAFVAAAQTLRPEAHP
jgi:hypothetical protein